MIYLKTGLPGSGKTLSLVDVGRQLAKEGRTVFYEGIKDVAEDELGIQKFPGEIQDWARVLQPNDVLLVDEITRYPELRRGGTRMNVPPWVEELTRNRHYGVDLYFCTQDPKNADSFVRRLVNKHEHYVNKFGAQVSRVYTWPECCDDIEMRGNRERADQADYAYPVELFDKYKSAELHTRKKYTPRKLKMLYWSLAACVLCLIVAVLAVRQFWPSRASAARAAPTGTHSIMGSSPDAGLAVGDAKKKLTKSEWLEQMVPRVNGFLWTAPAFDDRGIASEPETYCMAVENGPCRCISEQGTRIKLDQATCRQVAIDGFYNPYRKREAGFRGEEHHEQQRHDDSPASESIAAIAPPASSPHASSSSHSAHGFRPLAAPYEPGQFAPKSSQY